MQSSTKCPTFQHDPEDEPRQSIEMLGSRQLFRRNSNASSTWIAEDSQTLREKWSPFPWRSTLTILLLPLALAPIVSLSAAAEVASQSYIRGRDCYPNGLWKFATGATWEIMDSTYFFTPNLSFGNMSFTQVKVIDVAWDLLIGRGGQILLAWVNYLVFNEWLVYHMENHHTSYKLYAAVAFQTTSLSTLGVLGKEFLAFGRGTWKRFIRWLAILSMLLSTLYVLSFPTLMAAMTGYIAKSEPYIEDFEHNLVSFDRVDGVKYVVNDAQRIGYEKPLVIGATDNTLTGLMWQYMNSIEPSAQQNSSYIEPLSLGQKMFFAPEKPSRWGNTSLSAPSLNITIFPTDIVLGAGLQSESNSFFAIGGEQSELYNSSYVLLHGTCKPGEKYQWGFSYIFLFMVSIFNFVWACVMVGMWLDTRRGSRMYKGGRRPGLLTCIVEFARVIREEVGDGVDDMDEEEIRKRLSSGGALIVPKQEKTVRRVDSGERKRGWGRNLTRGSAF